MNLSTWEKSEYHMFRNPEDGRPVHISIEAMKDSKFRESLFNDGFTLIIYKT